MFKPGDMVISRWTGETAKVVMFCKDDKEMMWVKFKEKFVKGGFSKHSENVLIKNFESIH